MYNHDEIKRVELDLVTERFRKAIRACGNREVPMAIEPKGQTLYKVNRTLSNR